MNEYRDMLFTSAMKGDLDSFDKLGVEDKRDVIILLELNNDSLSLLYQNHFNNKTEQVRNMKQFLVN